MLYASLITGFVCLVWALIGLGEAHSGVGRVFRELEDTNELANGESEIEKAI